MLQEMIGDTRALQLFMKTPDDTECMEADVPKHDDSWALNIIQVSMGTVLIDNFSVI